jgi:hypothetical protein
MKLVHDLADAHLAGEREDLLAAVAHVGGPAVPP